MPQKGAFRCWIKTHFNHFRLQTAPPLANPYFRQMLLNGIGFKTAQEGSVSKLVLKLT